MDGDAGCGQVPVRQNLCHQTAQRMADQDRLFGQFLYDIRIMVHEFGQGQLRQIGVIGLPFPKRAGGCVFVGPGERDGVVSFFSK